MRKWFLKPFQAAVVLGAVLTCSQVFAAERIILGNAQGMPLAATQDPGISAIFTELKSKAKKNGTVRVIVGVRVPFAPEGKLDHAEQAKQRSEIAVAQKAVLAKIPLLTGANRQPKRFSTIPFMGLELTEAELSELASMPEITSIEEDVIAAPMLGESVPLIGASSGAFMGYSGTGQTVAILDTGVDKNHPHLAGRVVSEACYSTTDVTEGIQSICPGGANESVSSNAAMPYASGVCPDSKCDHGTHVAGIAAGSQGVARGANIIAIQVFSKFPSAYCGGTTECALTYSTDQIKGLERVNALRSSYNIAAANMSLGGGQYFSNCDSGDKLAIKSIIDTLRSNGIATIIASGNNGYSNSMSAPACISSAISVGATWDAAGFTNNCGGNSVSAVDSVACYSNSASFLHLLAPGSQIYAPIPYGAYSYKGGTSMATPHVAGAWAVLKQKSPTSTVDQVLLTLSATGTLVQDPRNSITKPRINVATAVNSLGSPTAYTLSVAKAGTGTGTVTSSPSGINCGSDCSESYASGTSVTLTATPSAGHTFSGWSGACTGSTSSCMVSMNTAKSVSATFTQTPQATLSIANVGLGSGTVTRSGGAIHCGNTCTETLATGSLVTLTATPAVGSTFAGWSGSTCSGTGTCTFTLSASTTVTARFNPTSGSKTFTPLLETNIAGTQGSILHYSIDIPIGAKNLEIEIGGGTGDVDLYVKFGELPTTSSYDCRPYDVGNNELCSFPLPLNGRYFIMLRGYTEFSGVTLSASYQKDNDITPIINLLLLD